MKNTFLLLIFMSLVHCTSDNDSMTNKELLGVWHWTESTGGIDGRTETPESTGNTIYLEISSSLIKTYLNDVLQSELTYHIEIGESIRSSEKELLIIYENGFKQSFEVTDGQLSLFDECYDCFNSSYIK